MIWGYCHEEACKWIDLGPLLEVKRAASGNWHRPGGRDPLRNIQNGMEDMGKKLLS